MKQQIESSAARIAAGIQSVGAHIDFEVLSLPGGSVIAVLLWLYASCSLSSAVTTFLRGTTGRRLSSHR
jgi:hypothetical protein